MKNLKMKQKILILTVIPLMFTVVAVMVVSIYQMRSLGLQEVETVLRSIVYGDEDGYIFAFD